MWEYLHISPYFRDHTDIYLLKIPDKNYVKLERKKSIFEYGTAEAISDLEASF